jgi:hypothetical protein
MVEERLTDGRRIAEFLASEVTGHGDDLAPLAVADADPDVEPSAGGAFAYAIERDGERVASVFVEPERVRVEFGRGGDAVAEAAREEGLHVESAPADESASGEESAPADESVRLRTRVFVEDGAQVKWLLPALRAVASA